MCGGGINSKQLQLALEMAQQQVALSASWMKELAHQAGHAGIAEAEIKAAESDLKSARRALEDAIEAFELEETNFQVTTV
ncbi:MAG: hypothetical protein FWF11_00405 [Coriobacteriia bacterium]|nr:hypothetical protein [Coriobacteriia bacterium]